jgi:hypothetical protein
VHIRRQGWAKDGYPFVTGIWKLVDSISLVKIP